MKNEKEIREELREIEERMKFMQYADPMWDKLNSRKWTLKWVLGEMKGVAEDEG